MGQTPTANTSERWDLGFVTPNLELDAAFEFDGIAFVPGADARVGDIASNNEAARMLLDGFREQRGQGVRPSGVIFRSDNSFRDLWAAMVDARNCLAVSCVLNGWQLSIGCSNNFLVRDSDYFDFYPRWPSKDGKSLVYRGPSLHLVSMVGKSFIAQGHAYILRCRPPLCRAQPDEDLLSNLQKVWRRVHCPVKPKASDYRLLRSLSLAYEAGRVPQTMENPLYDHGKHCSMWISALETLAHPTRGHVSRQTVLDLLAKRALSDRRVAAKRVVRIGRSRRTPLNLVQRLCLSLYEARNAFLHGNKLPMHVFLPRRLAKGIRLLDVAPLIYLVALQAIVGTTARKRRLYRNASEAKRLAAIFDIMSYNTLENAFSRAVGWKNEFGMSA